MGAFGQRLQVVGAGVEAPCGLVRSNGGPTLIDNDPAAMMAMLGRELDRVRLTYDTSCICIVSPDGEEASAVMRDFARRFATRLRSYDAIFRFATDKHLLMLPHIGRGDAVRVIKRLRLQVMSEPFLDADGKNIGATATFGGTMLDCQTPLNEHLDRAAEAHDWALKGDGDSICIWTPQV